MPGARSANATATCTWPTSCRARGRCSRSSTRLYLDCALAWTRGGRATLTVTHGLPGSGKTFRSQQLLEAEGAIRLRSDVERKRLFGLGMSERSRDHGLDLYTPEATERTYSHLFQAARAILEAGHPVILDAAFLRRHERKQARNIADALQVPFSILHCEADLETMRSRLRTRGRDASEAGEDTLERLREVAEPLTPTELALVRQPRVSEAARASDPPLWGRKV